MPTSTKTTWRVKFYANLQWIGFKQGLNHDWTNIDRKSIAVIFDFAKWKEGMADPLDSVNDKDLFAKGVVPIDFYGLKGILKANKPYWDEVERLMQPRDDC